MQADRCLYEDDGRLFDSTKMLHGCIMNFKFIPPVKTITTWKSHVHEFAGVHTVKPG
jgi:hypothetical protein